MLIKSGEIVSQSSKANAALSKLDFAAETTESAPSGRPAARGPLKNQARAQN